MIQSNMNTIQFKRLRILRNKSTDTKSQSVATMINHTTLTECARTATMLKVEQRKLPDVNILIEPYMLRAFAKTVTLVSITKRRDQILRRLFQMCLPVH